MLCSYIWIKSTALAHYSKIVVMTLPSEAALLACVMPTHYSRPTPPREIMLLHSSSGTSRRGCLLPAIFEWCKDRNVMENGQKRKENSPPSSSSSSKRRRGDEDGSEGAAGFERELAALQATADPTSKWSRPPVPSFDPATDAMVFQQLEVDHYTGELDFSDVESPLASPVRVFATLQGTRHCPLRNIVHVELLMCQTSWKYWTLENILRMSWFRPGLH